jgi:hypothetical protein
MIHNFHFSLEAIDNFLDLALEELILGLFLLRQNFYQLMIIYDNLFLVLLLIILFGLDQKLDGIILGLLEKK